MTRALLLDTHVVLWLTAGDRRVAPVQELIEDDDSTVVISAISFVEVAIKHAIGKLAWSVRALRSVPVIGTTPTLPFSIDHADEVERLPLHHRDPFDRMLVAQARVDTLSIVTADPLIVAYDVPTIVV